MFTQPAPAPTSPGLTTSATAGNLPSISVSNANTSSSNSRASRLRGLSYLRNYTQTHLLSREQSNNSAGSGSGRSNGASSSNSNQRRQQTPSPTSATATTTRPFSTSFSAATSAILTRSISYSPSTSSTPTSPVGGANPSPTTRSNRFSLLLSPTTSNTSTSSTQQHRSKSSAHPLASPTPGSDVESPIANTNPSSSFTSASGSAHLAPSGVAPVRRSTESAIVPPIVTTTIAHGTTAGSAATGTTTATKVPDVTASALLGAPATNAIGTTTLEDGLTSMTRTRSATTTDAISRGDGNGNGLDVLPSIRLSAFYDARAPRPSLLFTPISRTLPTGSEVIRVGRYSERDNQPIVATNVPSAAPVGFKSKVVSRRHCEFWYEGGKWYIKDVKSSSGTFLNHIRLSPPGTESRPFPVNDGDIVQLGIDFKGGEEMIFRCVKMRLELNRGWQNKLNTFNMATHKRLRNMTSSSGNESSAYSQDCSICLNRIAPCQCLFVAPCSHTWHYKCIRALLSSPQYPIFQCPNCRAAADLEADIEESEEWEQLESDEGEGEKQNREGASLQVQGGATGEAPPRKSRESVRSVRSQRSARATGAMAATAAAAAAAAAAGSQQPSISPLLFPGTLDANGDMTMLLDPPEDIPLSTGNSSTGSGSRPPLSQHATSDPMPIPSALANTPASHPFASRNHGTRTPSPTGGGGLTNGHGSGHEGPITPRNDAGPWVFDGSGVRITSLEAAVTGEDTEIRDAP